MRFKDGMTETHLVGGGGMIMKTEHYYGLIAAGAGLIVVGLGVLVGSFIWRKRP